MPRPTPGTRIDHPVRRCQFSCHNAGLPHRLKFQATRTDGRAGVLSATRIIGALTSSVLYNRNRLEFTMRFLILGCAVLALSSAPVLAVENFIPLGQNYAPGDDEIPPIGSEQDRINAQLDIYETENYGEALRLKQFESRLNQFQQEPRNMGDDFRDY
jgi:hypothetical protein